MEVHLKSNQWTRGPDMAPPDLPGFMWARDNIWIVPGTVFPEVGGETLLFIVDPPPDARTLAALEPFRLNVVAGAVATPYGAMGYAVFAVTNPAGGPPYAAWEKFFAPLGDGEVLGLRALADQTHWHIFVLGSGSEVLNVLEFENVYELDSGLERIEEVCAEQPIVDFSAAASDVQDRFTTLQLFQMDTQQSGEERSPEELLDETLVRLHAFTKSDNRNGVRQIGESLHAVGGFELIQYAYSVCVQKYGDRGQPRLVEMW